MTFSLRLFPWPIAATIPLASGAESTIDPFCWKVTLPVPNSRGEALEVTSLDFPRYLSDPDSIPEKHSRFFRVENGASLFH